MAGARGELQGDGVDTFSTMPLFSCGRHDFPVLEVDIVT